MSDDLVRRTEAFVHEVVLPAEPELGLGHPSEDLRERLQSEARAAGLLAPHFPDGPDGGRLAMEAHAPVFEAAGYSLLGPLALNCAAPDEGNMHLLAEAATPDQRARYLAPLVAGSVRSCFAMTEPQPGAGSDPSALRTRAERSDGGWVIDGHKRLITGAEGAAFAICMARTGDGPRDATMFLVEAANPGFRVTGAPDTLDHAMIGGHCDVAFEECRVPDEAVLGGVGTAFEHAQTRLVSGRLTHCMRWLGLAQRSLDVALRLTQDRELFGTRLHDLGLAQGLIADSVIDLETGRATVREACRAIDAGARGIHESSVAKVYVSEAVGRVVDRSMQLAGGSGMTHTTPLARFSSEVRAFRVYDGPSEVHRWSIARRATRRWRQER